MATDSKPDPAEWLPQRLADGNSFGDNQFGLAPFNLVQVDLDQFPVEPVGVRLSRTGQFGLLPLLFFSGFCDRLFDRLF